MDVTSSAFFPLMARKYDEIAIFKMKYTQHKYKGWGSKCGGSQRYKSS